VKTDVVIGELLAEVDRTVGLAQTLVIFTTDHAVGPLPETAQAWKLPGGRFSGKTVDSAIQSALDARFGKAAWLLATGQAVYLNHDVIATRGLDGALVRRVAADAAAAVPHVARVFTREQLIGGAVPADRVSQRVARSYHARRSGDIEVVLEPYWVRPATDATHGSPYGYDAHIPLVLMGPGIVAGTYRAHVSLNDVAPTLAALLQTATPSGSSGRVLVEALAK
jgi:arylsulfatase A-like enzyme